MVLAFSLSFTVAGAPPAAAQLSGWLTERGEPHYCDDRGITELRAVPLKFVPGTPLIAEFDLDAATSLPRALDVVFDVAKRIGADVTLAGERVTRASLWLHLADEQDRQRIADALIRARAHSNTDEIHRRLWAVVACLRPGHDLRWDAQRQRVVELVEVPPPPGSAALTGELQLVPVSGHVHMLVWRWLSEAYPGVAEAEHSIH